MGRSATKATLRETKPEPRLKGGMVAYNKIINNNSDLKDSVTIAILIKIALGLHSIDFLVWST